ncbi:MAG: cell division ATP-binding protein FtsE [Thermodesulfobacteriota bacterium]
MLGISKTYPNNILALSDINLEISQGEFVFILGPSGSGKSTLLKILIGIEKPTCGEVIINGMRITSPNFKKFHQLRRQIGYVSQDFILLRDRTVWENVALPLEVVGYPQKAIKSKVREVLTRVGLQEREGDMILSLSAGEQQRLSIARALVHEPLLILADEPTGIFDNQMKEEVISLFGEVNQTGTTILLATQDKDLVQRFPYRVISLQGGRRMEFPPEEESI